MTRAEANPSMLVRGVTSSSFVRADRPLEERLGYASAELAEKSLGEWIHPDDRAPLLAAIETGEGRVSARHATQDGGWLALDWHVRRSGGEVFALGLSPSTDGSLAVGRSSARLQGCRDTLSETLDSMVRVIEDKHEGIRCSVLLLDGTDRVSVGSGPSLPADYNQAVEGLEIGPTVGSCGTASYWNLPVVVEDIQADPLWRNLADHARGAGVGGCWSYPIRTREGVVLGAVGFYPDVPRSPTEEEWIGLETAAHMIGLAVERGQAEAALRQSEAEAHAQSRLLGGVTSVVSSFVDKGDFLLTIRELVRAARDLTASDFACFAEEHDGELRVLATASAAPRVPGAAPMVASKPNGSNGSNEEQQAPRALDARLREAMDRGEALVWHASREARDSAAADLETLEVEEALLCVPILQETRAVAVLGAHKAFGSFTDAECEAAEALCRTASLVIESHERQLRQAALEAQLRHTNKLEALGVLAGGLAHDFNNMLSSILGHAELAGSTLPEEARALPMLEKIVTASTRAADLCNQMLAFAGRGVISVDRFDCNSLVQELGELLEVNVCETATFENDLCAEPVFVEADQSQIRRVLMNLITNASEALGESAGTIHVQTGARRLEANALELLQPGAGLEAGEYVELTVSDSGPGMTAEVQAKIFDPFFSTKFSGRGLGLAAVQGIVLGHRGAISVESELGAGTTFTIFLPRVPSPDRDAAERPEDPVSIRGQRLLVVDDEPDVREVFSAVLSDAGFQVIEAASGEEAVETFRARGDDIDAVLLDLSMPGLGGEATMRRLQELRPDVRVLLSSGYTEHDLVDRFHDLGFAGFLQKPARGSVIIAKVREVIGASSALA